VAKYLTIENKMVIIICWANYVRVHFRFSTCSAGHEETWVVEKGETCVAIAGEWDVKRKSCKLHAQWADFHGHSSAPPRATPLPSVFLHFSITFPHFSSLVWLFIMRLAKFLIALHRIFRWRVCRPLLCNLFKHTHVYKLLRLWDYILRYVLPSYTTTKQFAQCA